MKRRYKANYSVWILFFLLVFCIACFTSCGTNTLSETGSLSSEEENDLNTNSEKTKGSILEQKEKKEIRIEKEYKGGIKNGYLHTVNENNEKGSITHRTIYEENGAVYVDYSYEYGYDDNGGFTRKEYDANGDLKESRTHEENDSETKTTYYDENGRYDGETTRTNNEIGFDTETKFYHDGSVYPTYHHLDKYSNELGEYESIRYSYDFNGKQSIDERIEYENDEHKNYIKEKNVDNGYVSLIRYYDFKYDSKGRKISKQLVKIEKYNPNGTLIEIEDGVEYATIWEYNDNDDVVHTAKRNIETGQETDVTDYVYEYWD